MCVPACQRALSVDPAISAAANQDQRFGSAVAAEAIATSSWKEHSASYVASVPVDSAMIIAFVRTFESLEMQRVYSLSTI